jgi:hypothetical protein
MNDVVIKLWIVADVLLVASYIAYLWHVGLVIR